MATHDAKFDKIIELTGNDGAFQWRFNYIYNAAMVLCGCMAFMNIILALNVPDHWCHVPGRENTNFTLEQWKNLTLPIETDIKGLNSLSKCKMYNVSWETIQTWDYENLTKYQEKLQTIECDIHEFDKQWYESTIITQENWVCSRDLHKSNAFALNRIGEVIGAVFFGQLGDRFGRRIIFYVSVTSIVIGRMMIIWTTSYEKWFWFASIIGSLCHVSVFQSSFVIAVEISKPDDRSNVAILQNLSWTIGLCLLPLLYWYIRDWMTFSIISTVPLAIFLFIPTYMIESPRWLISRGRLKEAAFYLKRIAKINNKQIDMNEKLLQDMLPANEPEHLYGMLSLFHGFRLAKNTIILIVCGMSSTLSYFTLMLYIAQSPGNPFLSFFIQSVTEIPAFFLATYMADTLGRRWTNCSSFLLAAMFCIPTALLANIPEYEYIATYSTITVKFWTAITFFAMNLQSMEIYPTCLRQTGLSFNTIAANIVGVLGPYIAYLGTRYDSRYPILILMVFSIIGGICGLFLPETLHQKLPDSLEDAKLFGEDQKFWSLPKPAKDDEKAEIEEAIKLNPLQ